MTSAPLKSSYTQPGSYTVGPSTTSYTTTSYTTSNILSTNPADSSLRSSYTAPQSYTTTSTVPQSYTVTSTTHHHHTTPTGTTAPQSYTSQTYNLGPSTEYSYTISSGTTAAQKPSVNINITAQPGSTTKYSLPTPVQTVHTQPQVAQVDKPHDHDHGHDHDHRPKPQQHQGPEAASQNLENRSIGGLRNFQDFINLRTQLGFHLLNAQDAVLAIRDRVGHITHLSLDEFIMIFTELFRGKFANFYEFIDKLALIFQFVDTNNNGYLEIGETLQAFVHLFGGSEEDKIRASFYLFDLDNSGFLDHNEVYTMIYNTIMLLENSQGNIEEEREQQIAQMAKATAHDLFDTLDLDGDEKVSLDEFLVWYKGFQHGVKPEDIASAKKMRDARIQDLLKKGVVIDPHHDENAFDTEAYDELNKVGAFTSLIDDIRKKIPLEKVHVHLAVDLLRELHPNMTCNYPQFTVYLEKLIKQNNLPGVEQMGDIARKLFNALDDNKNGLLDLSEIVTGFSLLCGGSMYDKLRTAFDLFDTNRDKVLDFHETSRFMHAFFKFMRVQSPYLKLANGSAEDWAVALTHKLFEEVQVPKDQGIPIDTFEAWATSISKVE